MQHKGMMKETKNPNVIISILNWNKKKLLENCIISIFEHTRYPNYRICVYDQASEDGSREYLESLGDKVDVIHSPENTGFVHGNNEVMKKYGNSDIVLLNNDTMVTDGWLQSLVDCAYDEENIGIVGAKLIFPDGKLQEAGGEIYADGSGRNIGRSDNPYRKEYNFVKEVDYSSGACLYIKRNLLNIVKGFDERFSPAYYEDTDLCFSARKYGFQVMYQPKCKVIHIEGATSGVDITSGHKKYQEINRPKFVKKWEKVLQYHRKSYWEAPKRESNEQVLVVATTPPLHDRASGEFRLYQIVRTLSKHYDVVFLACNVRKSMGIDRYIEDLKGLGITVYANDVRMFPDLQYEEEAVFPVNLELLLKHNNFKAAFLEFYHVADYYIDPIRKHSPETVVITDSVDVHFTREFREADLKKDVLTQLQARINKRKEVSVYERSDVVIAVTVDDKKALLKESPGLDLKILPNIHEPSSDKVSSSGREGLLYVGCFAFPPNVDAVVNFCKNILPLVKENLPEIKTDLVGYAPPSEVLELQDENIAVRGYVPETRPYLDSALISIAPLRYGAGMKGKIGEALAYGLPVVTTSIGAEGMGVRHGEHLLIADDPEDFARAIMRLYKDEALWEKLSRNGRKFIEDNYSTQAVEKLILSIMRMLPGAEAKSTRRFSTCAREFSEETNFVVLDKVTAVISDCNDMAQTKRCIDNLMRNSDNLQEIIVIDDGSNIEFTEWLENSFIKYIRKSDDIRDDNAYLMQMMSASSEFVAFIHSDTVVAPHWDVRLINHLKSSDSAGAVAPVRSCYKKYETFYEFEGLAWQEHQNKGGKHKEVRDLSNCPCIMFPQKALDAAYENGNINNTSSAFFQLIRKAGFRLLLARDVIVHHEEEYSMPTKAKRASSDIKCSIIIHGYLNKENLFASVDSIVNQGIPNRQLEVIVIERSSYYQLKKQLQDEYPFVVKLIPMGSEQMKRALNSAVGEYIIVIKGDMIADKSLLEEHIRVHSEMSSEDIIVTGYTGSKSGRSGSALLEYLTSMRIDKGRSALSFDPYYRSSISAKKEIFHNTGLSDEMSFGWQIREFVYRSQMDGKQIVFNDNAIIYPCSDQRIDDISSEQKRAGREAVLLALKHPYRLCGLNNIKEKCKMDYLWKENLVESLMEISGEMEQLADEERDKFVIRDQRLLDVIYTTVLNYYYAMGISEALSEIEGERWLEEFINDKYKGENDIIDKIISENKMYELLLKSVAADQKGNEKDALDYALKAKHFCLEAPQPYYYLGEYYLKTGTFDLAESAYEECIKNQGRYVQYTKKIVPIGDYVSSSLFLVLSCMHQNKWDKTMKLIEGLERNNHIQKMNQELICKLYLAKCYSKKGMEPEAIEHYNKVLEIEPGHAEAVNHLAMIYLKRNEKVKAKNVLVDFMKTNTGNVSLLTAKDGNLIATARTNGQRLSLHSRYRPCKESEDVLFQAGELKDKIIVQAGMGLGYPVLAIWNCISKNTPVLALERDESLFNLALLNNLWEDFNSHDHFTVMAGKRDASEVLEKLEILTNTFPDKEVVVIKHSPSFKLYPEYYTSIHDKVVEFVSNRVRENVGV